ncbi:MAG: SDR family oxidoreductase [Alphaproteobacteria bacterium]|nr:SDR family oxidoreductase [Alphaproteobacteria bacterium]
MSAPVTMNATAEQASRVGSLKGKVALLTGSESGIGQTCALAMSRAGATIISTGRSEQGGSLSARGAGLLKGRELEPGSETVRQVRDQGGTADYIKLDVTVEQDWIDAVAIIEKQFGRLDILLNNAGNTTGGALEDTDMDTVLYMMRLNIEGAFLGTTHAWRLLKKSKGVVLNMNSTAGHYGSAGGFAYPASKGGMFGLSKAAALDGKPFGIRSISLHPGSTWTPGMARARKLTEQDFVAGIRKTRSMPLGYPLYPGDVATAVVYFASDAARKFSGIAFNIDGGMIAR